MMFSLNKKRVFALLLSGLLLFSAGFSLAGEGERIEVDFFWSEGCPYCAAEKAFLSELQDKYPQIEVRQHEFSENIELVKEFYGDYEIPSKEQGLVPATFMQGEYFVGFSEQIGEEIEMLVKKHLGEDVFPVERGIKIPFFGEISAERFSLPALAVILGFLDGFNVCSLGALVLILGLVIALKSKKKTLIFGGIFILVTVVVYGALVFFWHQLFSLIAPLIKRMEILIGVLALAGGAYLFKEFLKGWKGEAICRFGGISEGFSQKVKRIFESKSGIFALLGAISLFAAAVTVIEFPCTAFFPVLFAGILAEAGSTLSLSLFYIGLYILFYMLDEIIILLVAAFTMKIWIASPKFITFLNLFAALLLFLLAFYYLFGLF